MERWGVSECISKWEKARAGCRTQGERVPRGATQWSAGLMVARQGRKAPVRMRKLSVGSSAEWGRKERGVCVVHRGSHSPQC
jgi:hypothetical protein